MALILTTTRHETESSNSVREYSSDPLPVDLLIEIFSRVPLKSIARFRCVSKLWASILRRSDFTELFMTKSLTRPRLLFTVQSKGKLLFYSSPQPHNPDDNSSLVATSYHPTLVPDYHPTYISKPVCGLVLLQRWGQVPLICNPAKGKVQTLPKLPREEKYTPKGICLGYDLIGKQFKVLCLSLNNSLYNTHWILTLESGKRLWRKLEPEFSFKENGYIFGDICINGVLYIEGTLEGSFVIVCFDVSSEKFSFINKDEDMLPKPYEFSSSSFTLFNYRDKLGILRCVDQKFVLWVLEDAGNHKWSKHNIELSHFLKELVKETTCGWTIVGMTGRGEIVCWSESCICFYNIEMNTFKRVNFKGLEGLEHPSIYNTFVDYVENMKFM
ncbi:hypothetical protein N665_0030s0013 [Sinapis alba]|nr:hypothetical protein N665_0030s0013 [Sinapis alba]